MRLRGVLPAYNPFNFVLSFALDLAAVSCKGKYMIKEKLDQRNRDDFITQLKTFHFFLEILFSLFLVLELLLLSDLLSIPSRVGCAINVATYLENRDNKRQNFVYIFSITVYTQ